MAKLDTFVVSGRIIPRINDDLNALWHAFENGERWQRRTKRSKNRARYRHKQYSGDVQLERWGPALSFEITDDDSGMTSGAFIRFVQRHAGDSVDRIDIEFD